MTHQDRFEADTHMAAWLRTVMRNTYLDGQRQAWRRVDLDEAVFEAIPAPPSQEARVELAEVLTAIRALPDGRGSLVEGAMLGYGMKALAQAQGRPAGTVRRQLSEARRSLRGWFG
jgi:RNA polymerase sigma-70 factor (ECF subfamily)